MERIKVTSDEVMTTLRAVVAERPDYVYAKPEGTSHSYSCLYVHHGADTAVPGCLVGTVLHRLGVPLEALTRMEGNTARDVVPAVLDVAGRTAPLTISRLLDSAQVSQDDGDTWAEAMAAAENRFARR